MFMYDPRFVFITYNTGLIKSKSSAKYIAVLLLQTPQHLPLDIFCCCWLKAFHEPEGCHEWKKIFSRKTLKTSL